MAKITTMPAEAIISGFKGTLDFYYNMGLACVRKWPRSPGHKRTPAVEAQWPTFTLAVQLWNSIPLDIRAAYEVMASGTGLSMRDMFIRLYLSGYKKTITTVDELE